MHDFFENLKLSINYIWLTLVYIFIIIYFLDNVIIIFHEHHIIL